MIFFKTNLQLWTVHLIDVHHLIFHLKKKKLYNVVAVGCSIDCLGKSTVYRAKDTCTNNKTFNTVDVSFMCLYDFLDYQLQVWFFWPLTGKTLKIFNYDIVYISLRENVPFLR